MVYLYIVKIEVFHQILTAFLRTFASLVHEHSLLSTVHKFFKMEVEVLRTMGHNESTGKSYIRFWL